MCPKCSLTILSTVLKARTTIFGSGSPAAVVNTINMDCQPDFMLLTRARTIWLTQRMINSRISTAYDISVTKTSVTKQV